MPPVNVMPPFRALPRALTLVALVLTTGAVRAESAKEADLRLAASWCASAAKVIRGWRDGSLPARYTHRTLGIAGEELTRLDRSLAKSGDASRHEPIACAIDTVRQLADIVDRRDGASGQVVTLAQRLDAEAHALTPAPAR